MIGGDIIKQIIVRLDEETHQNLKLKTIQDGVTIQGFIQEFVKLYLDGDISAKELLEKAKK